MLIDDVFSKTMESKWTGIVLNLILIGMLSGLFLLLYWGFKPYNIVKYNVDELVMLKNSYEVGEPLTYRSSFCKSGDYSSTIIRTLHDGVIYIFPAISSHTSEGCWDFISTTTPTPNVPTGTYTFETEVIYRPNPLREITYHIKSNEFKIINEE